MPKETAKMTKIQEIDILIKGRVSVIGIVSPEESRIEAELKTLLWSQNVERVSRDQEPKRFVTWSIARGFITVLPETEAVESTAAPNPVNAILEAGGMGKGANMRPTVYLFKDLHPYLRTSPPTLRALRDAASALRRSNSTIILVGPTLDIPEDAKKDVRVIDWELPTAVEIEDQLDRYIDALGSRSVPIPVTLNGGKKDLIRALQGLTRVEAEQVIGQAIATHRVLDERAIAFSLKAKAQIIRSSGALTYIDQKAEYGDIGGLDLLKVWGRDSEESNTPEAKEYGVDPLTGVLIIGVPGCGKSLTAKAIAGPNRPLLRLDVGALYGSGVGQSEGQTRNMLKVAEAVAPCVLWFDEIEKALPGGSGERDGGTSSRVMSTILTWMQERTADVFIVATANDIGSMRPELIRRFDEVFFVDLPTDEERQDILKIHLNKRRPTAGLDLVKVSSATDDFTGSELEKVVKAALLEAYKDGRREVATKDLLMSADVIVPLATTMADGIAAMREWSQKARPASSRQASGARRKPSSDLGSFLEV